MSLNLSFQPADILLPKEKFEKWAVIACDQYTSDPAYWQKREDEVGDCPSALHIIFPEVYLSDKSSKAARIQAIHRTMRRYLSDGVLEEIPNTFVYTERRTQGGLRRGVIGLIDLEDYSFEKHTDAAIRATEETVEERIPPRVEIRRGASIETPHVLLLIDDPLHTVIEPLAEKADRFQTLYDFDLCAGGGHIKGYAPDAATGKALCEALEQLKAKNNGFLFAVGDGNHSLACAKECYRLDPTPRSRYALVEIVNIHDPSLHFEPIYRVLFGVDPQEVIAAFTAFCGGETDKKRGQLFTCVSEGSEHVLSVAPSAPLAVGTLQRFLDTWLPEHPEASVDYIHGEAALRQLAQKTNTLGFLFKGMEKSELFPAVAKGGSLPRKTFSMGEADDKRFYLECRALVATENN